MRDLELEVRGGHREGIEITKKGDLIVGKIVMGQGPISPVPVDVGIFHIHGNPVDAETVHIHRSPVNVGTVHVHRNIQAGVQIPQRSDSPVTLLWML